MHQAAILGMFFSQTICVIAKGNLLQQVVRLKMHHRWVHLRPKVQNRQVTGFKILEGQGHDPLENFDTNF